MINKPYQINANGAVFDSTQPYTITWQVSGSVSTSFSILIINNSTGTTAWSLSNYSSFALQYTLPANTLTNGNQYKIQITVSDASNTTATSDFVVFTCSSMPSVSIGTIGVVQNQSNLFTAVYQQNENIILSSWIAILFDSSYNILQQSSIQTTYATPSPQTTPNSYDLSYTFGNLNSSLTYYVEFQATSSLGLTGTTGKIQFTTSFSQPTLYFPVQATNTGDCGINLTWTVSDIVGQSSNSTYYNNEEIDVTQGSAWFNQGFSIDNDFTLKFYLDSVTNWQVSTSTPVIVASATAPSNVMALWVQDANQVTPVNLNLTVSNTSPNNGLWIQDSNFTTPTSLGVVIDTTNSNPNVLWVNTTNPKDNLDLVHLVGSNGEIKLEYWNGQFNLYSIQNTVKTLVSSVAVTGNSYYVYIQQIGNTLSLGAQALS